MATWHQQKAGLSGLYAPHWREWKVVDDKPNQFASAVCFGDESTARAFAEKTGGLLIAPETPIVTGPGDYVTRDGRRVTVHAVNANPVTFPVQGAIWRMFRGKERPRGYHIWTRGGRSGLLGPRPSDIVGPWSPV